MTMATQFNQDQRYYDLLSYIVSNAVAGEIMAIENYSEMVPLFNTTDEKLETVQQATDEAKHVRVLAKLGENVGFKVERRIVEPQWLSVRRQFSEAVAQGHLASCLIIQDLMVETMAIVLYRTLGRGTDPDTTKFAGNILQDEVRHLHIGIDRIKALLDKDPEHVHDCLKRAHHGVMPEMFSMVSYNCHSLCGDLDIPCKTLGLDSIRTDLESVRVEALDTYMEMLDQVGFDVNVTTPLIASMSSYGTQPKADLGLCSATENVASCCSSQPPSCCG